MTVKDAQARVAYLNAQIRKRPLAVDDGCGLLEHLREELTELADAHYGGTPIELWKEAADVLVLLLAYCQSQTIPLELAFDDKMTENEGREWHPPDEAGVIRHRRGET